ncbi:MAG TPA: type II secretion system protein GspG [Oceanicaulis sp.]|jgi:general secretion pathway protein G|uniref:Type II secretion system core protein G n=1 Tax=Glycocaulis albus TaxID=1382801 RepID=A0ABQ1XVA8_9PROT|nr:type II secretion system major pseudopilin GspG [Glycocaulis albus]GGH03988.1 type II secretion system protein GspG [Glycocaulis albus]HCY54522.1 type II secretion system protein GspG [Oceanicaulis sp.]
MRLPTSPRDTEAGFTLVEIMVVVVIIGLLATVVVLNVLPSQDRARIEKARADIGRIEQAVEMFRLDMGRYPTTDEGLEVLVTAPADPRLAARFPEGGYINRLPEDPWGGQYQYMSPGEHGRFDVWSLGADARPGGEDNNADIGNWTAP